MNKIEVQLLLDKTGKSFATATFMAYVPTYCSNYYKALAQDDRGRQAIENFLRCIKRALYFCRQTLFSIEQCLDENQIRFFRERMVSLEGERFGRTIFHILRQLSSTLMPLYSPSEPFSKDSLSSL